MSLSSVTTGVIVILAIVLIASAAITVIDNKVLEIYREINKLTGKLKNRYNTLVLDCADGELLPDNKVKYFVLVCNNTLRKIIPFSQESFFSKVETLCKYALNKYCRVYAVSSGSINNVVIVPNTTPSEYTSSKIAVIREVIPGLIYGISDIVAPIPNTMWKNSYFTINTTLSFSEIRELVQKYPYFTITTTSDAYYKIMQITKLWNNIYVNINSSMIGGLGNTIIVPWTVSLKLIIERESSNSKPKVFIGDDDEQYNFTLFNVTNVISVSFYTPSTRGIYIDLSRVYKVNVTILAPSPIVISNNSINSLASLVKITYYILQSNSMPIILPLLNNYKVTKQPLIHIDYPLMSEALRAYIKLYNISITNTLGKSLVIKLSKEFKAYILDSNGSVTSLTLTLPRYAEVIAPGTIYIDNTIVLDDLPLLKLIDFKKLNDINATIKLYIDVNNTMDYVIQPPLSINISWDPVYAKLTIVDSYGSKYSINALGIKLPRKISMIRGAILINMSILGVRRLILNRTSAVVYAISYNMSINLVKPIPLVGIIKIENSSPRITVSNKTVSIIERDLRETKIYYVGLYKVNITSQGYSLGFTITIQCLDNRLVTK